MRIQHDKEQGETDNKYTAGNEGRWETGEIHREQIRNNETREVKRNTKHLRQETITIKQEITLRWR